MNSRSTVLRSAPMKRLLIVYHTQFGATAADGARPRGTARSRSTTSIPLFLRAADAGVAELLAADALLIATSENFGGMAGIVKDFLERTYYPCEGKLEGRPYAVLVCAGTDGTGAMRDVDRVATGLASPQGASGAHPQERRHGTARDRAGRRARAMPRNRRDARGRRGGRHLLTASAGLQVARRATAAGARRGRRSKPR